ncbi:ATP synthase subunit b, sodium ion specific [Methylacidimicrobium cyclopophantes]|uniref:ATP synthase subunit b, sodium ion specific n=1 Tax=Methylacidimicrobium cyclopophantes TaxID=1041766 RepID=A0A5E6M9M7_9BACT|nr:F0F1 ATP synthase subunit delta [Methylacidimicrobium cyclopophantes]VVM05927.1 ATP synthase subunit b, sodium ion specific [Methylacidimicrobium cyclopophantes]
MSLDWTTFSLQVINFLVLVWLLHRLLFRPVLRMVAERRAATARAWEEAERVKKEGEELRKAYENRMAIWEAEKEKARAKLLEELQAERSRLQRENDRLIQEERERARAVEAHRLAALEQAAETRALRIGTRFVSRFLHDLVTPDLEGKLVDRTVEEIERLPPEKREEIRGAIAREGVEQIEIRTAFPLEQGRRDRLAKALQEVCGRELPCQFLVDSSLGAGVRAVVGGWMARANVKDELLFFASKGEG